MESCLVGGGEMGALMRDTDWSKTKLGNVDDWPRSLKTMLGVVLGSRFPMLIWWGPDMLHLYNDAYRPILRDKHPRSLAAPAADVWAEVWDVAGPMARGVMEGGPPTWTEDLQLFIQSGAMAEETYFTFSYSSIPDDTGGVGGILNTVQETTAKVQGERQIRMLHDLAARTAESKSMDEAFATVFEVLANNQLDLPFVLVYRPVDDETSVQLVRSCGLDDYDGLANIGRTTLQHGAPFWPLAEVQPSDPALVVDGLSERFGPLPLGPWKARPEQAVVLPLLHTGNTTPHAYLIAGVSPHRTLDERYRRFFDATANQVASVITNAKTLAEEIHRNEQHAELDRAKTVFFSNISHELRTPLTLMLGPVEDSLSDTTEPLTTRHRQRLELVQHNSLRLLKLVNALLDFARIEAGRMEASYVPTNIAEFTSSLASVFRSTVEQAGLSLVVTCPTLEASVYVDRTMWEKIVLNLLSNAFKFTFSGQITVALRETEQAAVLTVQDTGTGIPEAELPRLFERFHMVTGAKARTQEGTGIGLSLVQSLVHLHGGTIAVDSVVNEGTTFTVTIPTGCKHLPSSSVATAETESASVTRGTIFAQEVQRWLPDHVNDADGTDELPSQVPTGAPTARVLLVDDNTDLRTYLARLLAPHYEVDTAPDGRAAIDIVHERPPDLVLSDIMMPRLDGFGLLAELRSNTDTMTIPVILLSARAGEEAAVEGLDSGADDYLTKPFSAKELLARVRTHLELARIRREWSVELERANNELEAFSYSVSHDLRTPLRAIHGFSTVLLNRYGDQLDDQGQHYLERVRAGTQRMSTLIDDLLNLARLTRTPIREQPVDLTQLANEIVDELRAKDPERNAVMDISDGLTTKGDRQLLTVVLENLFGNAWKFTSKREQSHICFGSQVEGTETVYFVRDNGAGFDMEYADKLFDPFQRLHTATDFEGTGVGLATVQRIIGRHEGRVWASASPNNGATFFFTLGENNDAAPRHPSH